MTAVSRHYAPRGGQTTVVIPLRDRRGRVRARALVDAIDADAVRRRRWCLCGRGGYVSSRTGGTNVYLHRFILNAPAGMEVDHINGDRLDNRRANLRLVTPAQNRQNQHWLSGRGTSRFRGVSFEKASGRWVAHVKLGGRARNLGRFATEKDAAAAAATFRSAHMPYSSREAEPGRLTREGDDRAPTARSVVDA